MATNLTRVPLMRQVAARSYSKLAPVSGKPCYEIRSTTLTNKTVVVSADNESAITRISIIVRAGSRNETADNLGVTHLLRNCAGLSTKNVSQFLITRNIQQVGASLTATSDRETISYTLEGTKSAVDKVLPFLTEVATQQVFKPWEVSDTIPRLHLDIATRPLQVRAIDLLHKAAYRTGLGNSLFIPKFQIGKISSETLQHYVCTNFTNSRTAVVGAGIGHDALCKIAQGITLGSGGGDCSPSPYKGGEVRSDKGGDLAFVAIATEGASIQNPKEALAFAVLQRALGAGPQIKWSSRDNGLLSRAVTDVDFAGCAINTNYSDTGLFGVLVAVPAKSAGKVVKCAYNLLNNLCASEGDITRGKNQVKTALLLESESGAHVVESLGNQAVLTGNPQSAATLADMVDELSNSDIQQAVEKVKKGKKSLASVGNLVDVPYLADL
ncbi:cytochrome b-c1 complex subunit 2, mitochondrial [Aethina tumida]|uniref:cytochrome b-c1 complex subunit 2, mitochondrial n=1 Tax=Aethina tumida TaxID=116153 RepID=UPI00096B0694|nr:cytochrome b-c1 complex subunit 2, mitochondrial [Aethina tumida]